MKVVKIFILLFLFGQNIDVFAQSCNCKEYIYLNEPEANAVLKFEIGAPVLLTEKLGSNGGTQGIHHWYPGLGTSMISSPHGIASDLNGNLYIASTTVAGSSVSKLNCDGVRDQVYNLNVEPVLNMFSIGNTLFKTTILGPEAHDLCTNNEIGFACLAHSDGNQFTGNPLLPQQTWGLSYNEVTERTYLTTFHSSYRYLWVLTKDELINGVNSTSETCKQPLLERGSFTQTFANISVGDKWLPNDVQEMYGVTSDNSGNIYIVTWRSGPNYWQNVIILKYNALGEYQAQSVVNSRIVATHGLVWSETNRLYLANRTDDLTVDCISVLDANNLSYIGTGAPNPGLPANNAAKAIGILKECCPVNLPSTFQREVCGAIGSKFYLNQEAFDDCDGVVCGSSWSPVGTLTNMTFDACDNSVVVNGPGCGTFSLNISAVTSTGCGAQTSTFTICYTVPSATITPSQGTCTGATANNDAVINITAATNANQAGISTGATYTGPAYNGVGTVTITGGIASFTSLMHNTQYTVRIFNGNNDCYVDYIVTTPTVTCCITPTATAAATNPTCAGELAQSNGTITISGFTTGQRYQYSTGATFNSGAATPISITTIPAGGVIVNTLANTTQQYTVRIYDAIDNACFVDRTVNVSATVCSTCNCQEYIYLNEPDISAVLKFRVNSDGSLTEVLGANGGTSPNQHWYPGNGTSQLPRPHGLGTDLNGRLYVGNQESSPTSFGQLDCDGNISPTSPTTVIDPAGQTYNAFSIGNILYKTGTGEIRAYNTCTGMLIGEKCLAGANHSIFQGPFYWGLSYNEVTGMVYATELNGTVWRMTVSELNDFATCANPILVSNSNYHPLFIPVGTQFLPGRVTCCNETMGIVGDDAGNMYIVVFGGGILKYNANAQFVKSFNADGNTNDIPQLNFTRGIIWSRTNNRLYLSNQTDDPLVDCISAFDTELVYLGTAAPNPNLPGVNNTAKAIGILKECCPVNLPSTFQKEVCGAIGTKFYLNQEAFDDCDGVVCGSSWTPVGTLTGMTFDACDNSVTVTGSGCGTFTLNIGAVISTGCVAQTSTFTICNTVPSATVEAGPAGTCTGSTPNSDAVINITAAINANRAGISTGTSYAGLTYTGSGIITINGGIASFINLMHGTDYTVRIFNGSNECYVDYTVTTPVIQCCNIAAIVAQNIECFDNGTPALITDNRIRFSANVTNTNTSLPGYNVTINGGTTITPNMNVPYGVTQFTLGAGTAGGGATFTVTVTDSATPGCTQTFQVIDPDTCTPSTPECPPVQCGTATIQVNGN